MRSGFHHHPVGRIILLLIFLCLVGLVGLPLTSGNRQALSLDSEKSLEAGATKNLEKESYGVAHQMDSHNALLGILKRSEPAKMAQSPISEISTSKPSLTTEAQRKNS